MAPTAGMLRYNTDNKYQEKSTDEGSNWNELDLSGQTKGSGAIAQTITTTGNIDDLQLNGRITNLRLNNASLSTIRGLIPKVGIGDICYIASVGAGQVDLSHQDTGEATSSRRLINFAASAKTSLAAGIGIACYIYDGTVGGDGTTYRWRLVSHEQGAWITPTFNSGDYTISGGGTITVDSGDVIENSYMLRGKTLHMSYYINNFSTTGTVSYVELLVPGGFTMVRGHRDIQAGVSNNGVYSSNMREYDASGTKIRHYGTAGGSGWNVGTNSHMITGQLMVEVN